MKKELTEQQRDRLEIKMANSKLENGIFIGFFTFGFISGLIWDSMKISIIGGFIGMGIMIYLHILQKRKYKKLIQKYNEKYTEPYYTE